MWLFLGHVWPTASEKFKFNVTDRSPQFISGKLDFFVINSRLVFGHLEQKIQRVQFLCIYTCKIRCSDQLTLTYSLILLLTLLHYCCHSSVVTLLLCNSFHSFSFNFPVASNEGCVLLTSCSKFSIHFKYTAIIFISFTFVQFITSLQVTFLFVLIHLLFTISSLYIVVYEHYNVACFSSSTSNHKRVTCYLESSTNPS